MTTASTGRSGLSTHVLLAFATAVTALVGVMAIAGSAPRPAPVGIPDPGLVVGWALPIIKLIADGAGVATIGFLLLAAFLLTSGKDVVEGLAVDAVRIARRAAWVWAGASAALYVLTTSDIFATPLTDLTGRLLVSLGRDSALGRGIALQALGALVLALALRWTIGVASLAALLGLALATSAPIALTGHAASSGSHDLATTSLFLHLVGMSLWVGGLIALAWVAHRGSKRLDAAIARYSVVAFWAFVLVGVSGVVNAAVRLGTVGEVTGSTYGRIVLAKVAAFGLLGVFGWWQRRRIVSAGSGFARLALTELLVMATAIGIAVALSRTPTPVGEDVLRTPAEELLGGPMPDAPTLLGLLGGFNGNGVGLAVVGLGTALYLRGVWALRARQVDWPLGRTLAWLAGMVVIAWATFGGLGTYSHVLFSAHMVSHMMLSMVAPIFLVLGAPMTLALRTLPGPRQPGEPSPRLLLNRFLHSRYSRIVTHPLVGPGLFIGSLYGLYFTSIFETLMRNHWGHAVMELHFLAVGTLFYYVIIGVDPAPRALPPLARFGTLLVTIPFHAFFAIAVMSASEVFAESYWSALERPYRTDLLDDQYLGGSIAWAMGEVPLLIVMAALFVQWIRSDAREARRLDRAAERDDDAALRAYNQHLEDLARHGKRRDP